MVAFFGRLEAAGRSRSSSAPSYLRTHPLTTERIADIEARIRNVPYRQRVDSLEFALVKARARVLQDDTMQGWRDATVFFTEQLQQGVRAQVMGARYGLAMIALRQKDAARASTLLEALHVDVARETSVPSSPALLSMDIEYRLVSGQAEQALALATEGRNRFPLSRALTMQYAESLLAAGKKEAAAAFLRDQSQLYRQDAGVQRALARVYAEQGKQALQHLALAEFYFLSGALPSALEQLRIARTSPDASFYDQAMIDARERELQAAWQEMMAQTKRR
jgi:predicted Zn-dependent protease